MSQQPDLPMPNAKPAKKRTHATGWPFIPVTNTPVREPKPSVEYRITIPTHGTQPNRQTGLRSLASARRNARIVMGNFLKREAKDSDFILFEQGGLFGFVPEGGTVPTDAAAPVTSAAKPVFVASDFDLTSAQRASVRDNLFALIDGETGRYKDPTVDDEAIATMSGAPVEFVTFLRLQVYGEPTPVPLSIEKAALEALRAEGETLQSMVADLTARINTALGNA